MTTTKIYKGDCVLQALTIQKQNPQLLLCFSYATLHYKEISTGNKGDDRVIHSWCEGITDKGETTCIDFSNNHETIVLQKDYYKVHNINKTKVVRQTIQEVNECLKKYNYIGGMWFSEFLEELK